MADEMKRRDHIEALVGDRMTANKADHICERDGFAVTGVVLTLPDGRACIVNRSAVRWLFGHRELWELMHGSEPIGEMHEDGVVWYGKNPHAHPVGTRFFTTPAPSTRATHVPAAVPDGWKLVPVEPTDTMIYMMTRATNTKEERIDSYRAMLSAAPAAPAVQARWIDPNDKTQKQYLPWIGEQVLFCHDGLTYYGQHTGGCFQTGKGAKVRSFNTWECHWMYPPAAMQKGSTTEAGR